MRRTASNRTDKQGLFHVPISYPARRFMSIMSEKTKWYNACMAVYADNRKAHFDYEILESFEAGLILQGLEVKSIKAKRVSLEDSYLTLHNGSLWLINAHIYPLQPGNSPKEYKTERPRQALVHRKELNRLIGSIKEKRLTLIPLQIYNVKQYLKLKFCLAKSKRKFEKRDLLRERDIRRDMQRSLKTGS